jgi:hypothetical protein
MSIPIQGLAPLLQVSDMPASLAFCCDALGLSPKQDRQMTLAWYCFGESESS